MKIAIPLIVFWITVGFAATAQGADTIRVSGFGINPGDFSDASLPVQRAIESCRNKPGAVLWFDKGRYDFWPAGGFKRALYASNTSSEAELADKTKTFGLFFEKINDLIIEGNGAVFIFHGKMSPWAFVECSNICMRHIIIDFERPTMSEMTFRDISDTGITATIHPQATFAIINNRLQWYGEGWGMKQFHAILTNPVTGVNTYSSWEPFLRSQVTQPDPSTVRFTGNFSGVSARPGDVLTIRDPLRDQVGGFINLSKNISLKNINIRYMHGFGILGQFSEDLSFDSVNVMPDASGRRTMSGFADAMHFSGCRGEIKIENSHFKGMHDDPINVHGTHLKIMEVLSPVKLRIRFMHSQTYGFKAFFPQDSIAFVHPESLEVFAKGVVRTSEMINRHEMLIELSAPAPKEMIKGDCLENLSWNPSLTVRNCRFESVNTRGMLVTTRGRVLIEGNTFYRTGMHAILIADDALSWYESGPVEDVWIRNNSFEECAYGSAPNNYAIAIAPENHIAVKDYFVHHNVRIENNSFKVYDAPILTAKSTEGLVFSNNTVVQSHFMKAGVNKASFNLEACKGVSISKNTFNTDWKPVIRLERTLHSAVKTKEKGVYQVIVEN